MKRIKYLLILMISFFIFNLTVLAESSNFQSMVFMEPDITENQVSVSLGFSGEEAMIVKHKFAYDNKKLKLVEIKALDNFNVVVSKEVKDGRYSIVSVLADSDYSFNNSNYAVAIFELLPSFKNKKGAEVFIYDFEGTGPDEIKFRNNGQIMMMNRDNVSYMSSVVKNIDKSTKTEYWFRKWYWIFIVLGLGIIGAIIAIIKMPTKRKVESRDKAIADQLKGENYDTNQNFKIDSSVLEQIGKQETPIDINQAIIVNENVKPFGDTHDKEQIMIPDAENLGGVINTNEMTINPTPMVVSPVETPVVTEEQQMIDPFNMTINSEPTTAEQVNTELNNAGVVDMNENLIQINTNILEPAQNVSVSEAPTFNIDQAPQVFQEVQAPISVQEINPTVAPVQEVAPVVMSPVEPAPIEMPSMAQPVAQPIEMPSMAQPVAQPTPSPIEMPSVAQPVQPSIINQVPTENSQVVSAESNPNNGIMNILLILAVSLSCLLMGNVKADEYKVEDLRKCILGIGNCDTELDYNFDGKYDILDLLATKDTNNCNFENLMKTDPGFKDIHGGNSNIMSDDQIALTTTTKIGKFTRKTTSKKTTTMKGTRATTTKNSSGGSVKTTRATTTKAPTTKKSTTARSTTSKTTKTTTTKVTTIKTTTAVPVYKVMVDVQNGTPAIQNIEIKKGGTTYIDLTPGKDMVGCTVSCDGKKVTVSKTTDCKKVTFKTPTGDDSCHVVFAPKSSYKITVVMVMPSGSKSTKYITTEYQGDGSISYSFSKSYTTKSVVCDPEIRSSFDGAKFSVFGITKDSKCTITLGSDDNSSASEGGN